MKEVLLSNSSSQLPQLMPFRNKLAEQDKSFLNMTYTVDTTKRERQREFQKEFGVGDAIRGFLPRARSSGPRRSCKEGISPTNVRNFSDSTLYSAKSCALPSLNTQLNSQKSVCTQRPWSRTHEELRKFKETLQMNKLEHKPEVSLQKK